MGAMDGSGTGGLRPGMSGVTPPSGLLDVLNVAAVVLDSEGRVALWSPQAEQLFGWTAAEALGQPAARLLAAKEHVGLVTELFARVMGGAGDWAGAFPVRRRDGTTRLVEFRNMRLLDEHGDMFALGIATDRTRLRQLERDLALSARLVAQSPIGLAVLDTELRYVLVNPTLERINGLPAEQHIGRGVREALAFLDDAEAAESAMRQVLATGTPLLEQFTAGRTHGGDRTEHAWSVSYYRLEDATGRVLGLATSVVDVTQSHRAAIEIARSRRRSPSSRTPPSASAPPSTSTRPPVSSPTSSSPSSPTSPPSTSSTPSSKAGRPCGPPPTSPRCSAPWPSRPPTPATPYAPPTRPATSPATPRTGWSPSP